MPFAAWDRFNDRTMGRDAGGKLMSAADSYMRYYTRTMTRAEYRNVHSQARQMVNSKRLRSMTLVEHMVWSNSLKPVGNRGYSWVNKEACKRWCYLMFRHLQLMRRALHDVEWGWTPDSEATRRN